MWSVSRIWWGRSGPESTRRKRSRLLSEGRPDAERRAGGDGPAGDDAEGRAAGNGPLGEDAEAGSGGTDAPDAGGAGGAVPEVIVALDYPEAAPARALVDRLPEGTWYKVGMELFAAAGPDFVERLSAAGHPVFLDLKLHDIPNTAAGAVRSAAGLGARLVTVHAAGGRAMIEAAVTAARESAVPPGTARSGGGAAAAEAPEALRILAVTVLTSLDRAGLEQVWPGASLDEAVGRLAGLAREAGAHGAVASVGECRAVKLACGPGFRVATPGIRLPGGEAHDQKRVATPAAAREAGADYLVVGRAITAAGDPAAALEEVRRALRA